MLVTVFTFRSDKTIPTGLRTKDTPQPHTPKGTNKSEMRGEQTGGK